ncbi:MAG: undecaprenyldiphospho-muramoylpentapeptide beta-N-acetylglucosaminyltransferase [Alphaproteobacteria bacterium]|nr:undecaprenyldiphospho-muramoylpentapeptide beta-N-acetylglucosaminyltransferase [Alphaproteobacteria bacterium]
MSDQGLIILAAGGTGGHLFPAQALAEVLVARGFRVQLMTDERVRDYGKSFPAEDVHIIPSASPSLSKPWLLPARALKLYGGYRKARRLMRRLKPLAVVGFGGYPSFPPLFAARSLKIPTLVHEQNAVLGRANKLLATRVDAIATSFHEVRGLPPAAEAKCVFTGNPVRAIALAQKAASYRDVLPNGPFNLLVFGGSQGAKFFSDFMPGVFAAMPEAARARIRLVQQCRNEDLARVQEAYARLGISAELNAFFGDMPKRLAEAQLVVCRSGASSIAELGVIGRPAALVPLPHAIDNDQLRNAQSFASAGAGWVFPQNELKPQEFAGFLTRLMGEGTTLMKAAGNALNQGAPDAAQRLADVTLKHALARR